jgi:hypothetical protein
MPINLPLDEMSVAEKLQAMEDLWNDLSQKPAEIPSPEWHTDVLRARQQRINNGEAKFYDIEDAKQKCTELIK